jgi:hypothetical protein
MPTERFNSCEPHTLADLLVGWPTQDELTDTPPGIIDVPYVDLFPCAQAGYSGGIYFSPDDESKAKMGLGPQDHGVGPVRIKLDRGGVNRLITTLRNARDEAFGADA